MTRGAIRRYAHQLIRQIVGAGYEADPLAEDALLDDEMDELARLSDATWVRKRANLVANQAEYGTPAVRRPVAVMVLDADGKLRNLVTLTVREMDALDGEQGGGGPNQWRNAPAAASARYAVIQGQNLIRLHPKPSADHTNGLVVEGYGLPLGVWAYDNDCNPLPPDDSQECPLPADLHRTLSMGLAVAVLRTYTGLSDPALLERLAAEYEGRKDALTLDASLRVPGPNAARSGGVDSVYGKAAGPGRAGEAAPERKRLRGGGRLTYVTNPRGN